MDTCGFVCSLLEALISKAMKLTSASRVREVEVARGTIGNAIIMIGELARRVILSFF